MKRFNSIVLSEVEPSIHDLWIMNALETTKDGTKAIHGKSMWWYSPKGWTKLFDFDTRYNVNTEYLYTGSATPLDEKETYNPKVGIVDVDRKYYIYDASRQLAKNGNLVNETGLKYHVDDLQSQINALKARVTTLESKVSTLESKTSSLESTVGQHTALLNTINSILNTINSRLDSLESQS